MLMLTYCSTHTFIFHNPVLSEKRVKKFLISLVLWTYTNNSFIMKILNYSKLNQSIGKNIWSRMLFTIWRRSPFFIEVQKSVYSKKLMQDTINRYELYFHNQEWHNEYWQPKASKFFPSILIITDKHYDVQSPYFRIFQANSIESFMNNLTVKS